MSYRVFQWASGTVGRHVARAAITRPDLDLVGMHVTNPDKVGRDVGEILGVAATGIAATSDIELILRSDADVVVHAPLPSMVYSEHADKDLDDICRLLSAGKNVITVVGYMYPKAHGPEVVERLNNACKRGSSSFHSTGLNPGWMGDLIPLVMSALARRIDHIHVLEISNFEHYPSPEIMFESMGFGSTPDKFAQANTRRMGWLNSLFNESLHMVADGLGASLDRLETSLETALAEQDLKTASGIVKTGTVAGQHWTWSGIIGEKVRLVHETVWRMHSTVAPHWATGKHSVTIKGNPGMHLEFDADYVTDGLEATAMHAVNAIPLVVEALPGIRSFLDLPWIMGRGALSND